MKPVNDNLASTLSGSNTGHPTHTAETYPGIEHMTWAQRGELATRLLAENARLMVTLDWISKIALTNYEQDTNLRANGARTLKRIGEKADEAIAALKG